MDSGVGASWGSGSSRPWGEHVSLGCAPAVLMERWRCSGGRTNLVMFQLHPRRQIIRHGQDISQRVQLEHIK